ncbi:MAG: hypothetical protein JNL28_06660 [Planctomycetes bacterium]|nr:hypothetical protein [Planctomycetota bacterium]
MNVAEAYDPVRALTASWRLLMRAPLPLFIGGAILVLVSDGWSTGVNFGESHGRPRGEVVLGVLLVGLCCGLIGLLISSWLSVGLANAVEKTVTNGSARFDDLFESRGRFFDMVLLRVLFALIWIGALVPIAAAILIGLLAANAWHWPPGPVILAVFTFVLLYLPVLMYVVLGFSLSVQAVAIEGLAPTAALRRSWSLVHGNRLRILLYWIVMIVFTLLGFCLCCIGMLWTGAMAQVAANDSYLALVKSDEYAGSWLTTNVPPSPAQSPPPMPG